MILKLNISPSPNRKVLEMVAHLKMAKLRRFALAALGCVQLYKNLGEMDWYLKHLNGVLVNPFFQKGTITKLQKKAKAVPFYIKCNFSVKMRG